MFVHVTSTFPSIPSFPLPKPFEVDIGRERINLFYGSQDVVDKGRKQLDVCLGEGCVVLVLGANFYTLLLLHFSLTVHYIFSITFQFSGWGLGPPNRPSVDFHPLKYNIIKNGSKVQIRLKRNFAGN